MPDADRLKAIVIVPLEDDQAKTVIPILIVLVARRVSFASASARHSKVSIVRFSWHNFFVLWGPRTSVLENEAPVRKYSAAGS